MSHEVAGSNLRNQALRLAFAITVGLFAESLRGAALPMLAPLIAVQLLAVPGPAPGRKIAIVLLGTMAAASLLAWMVSVLTVGNTALYVLGIGLLYTWGFSLAFHPRAAMLGSMFITMTVVVTAMSAASTAAAIWIVTELLGSVIVGFCLIYLTHVLLPHRGAPTAIPGRQGGAAPMLMPVPRAVLAAIVMIPVQLYLTSDGVAAMVVLMTIATMLRQPSVTASSQYGFTFACGNALGGFMAAATVSLLILHQTGLVMLSLTAAGSLILVSTFVGSRINSQVMLPAMVAYTVLYGLVLSPLPLGQDVPYLQRVGQITMAAIYALAMVSLLAPIARRFAARPHDAQA